MPEEKTTGKTFEVEFEILAAVRLPGTKPQPATSSSAAKPMAVSKGQYERNWDYAFQSPTKGEA